ncbi:MAG: hypothetical protein J7497_14790, partial [Chitinophagaceae bacterium]|nr:hypothetical protein [Chitinophagaceae bacterium]
MKLLLLLLAFSFNNIEQNELLLPGKDTIPTVDFCDLPNYAGKKVRVTCSYSGIEEYWGLGRIKKGKCEKEYLVNLGIIDYEKVPKRFQKKFTAVANSYWNSYLMLTMIGTFETGRDGYGHLGSNNAQFNV